MVELVSTISNIAVSWIELLGIGVDCLGAVAETGICSGVIASIMTGCSGIVGSIITAFPGMLGK